MCVLHSSQFKSVFQSMNYLCVKRDQLWKEAISLGPEFYIRLLVYVRGWFFFLPLTHVCAHIQMITQFEIKIKAPLNTTVPCWNPKHPNFVIWFCNYTASCDDIEIAWITWQRNYVETFEVVKLIWPSLSLIWVGGRGGCKMEWGL